MFLMGSLQEESGRDTDGSQDNGALLNASQDSDAVSPIHGQDTSEIENAMPPPNNCEEYEDTSTNSKLTLGKLEHCVVS